VAPARQAPPREVDDLNVRVLAVIAAAGVALFLLVFPYRLDAAGHFAAGFGLTVLIVAPAAGHRIELRHAAVVAVVAVFLFGLATEVTIFRSLLADPLDIGHQTFGSIAAATAFAGVGSIGAESRRPLLVVGALVLLIGFMFRFGIIGAFTWMLPA